MIYKCFITLLKYIAGLLFISVIWCFCWWMYLVWKSTNNIMVLMLLITNWACIHLYIKSNTKKVKPPSTIPVIVIMIILGIILICHYRMSAQWVSEDITEYILSNLSGTISYMMNYTRWHANVLKMEGYLGCLDLYVMWSALSYVWLGRLKLRSISFKKLKSSIEIQK